MACGKPASGVIIDAATIDATSDSTTDAEPGRDATPDDSLHEAIFATYGVIETIAGTGQVEGKGTNSWQQDFEGTAGIGVELSRPHMAQSDLTGAIYIADKDAHGVRKLLPNGTIETVAGTSVAGDDGDGPGLATNMRLSFPNGLWVGGSGVVYLLDLGNDKVRRLEDDSMQTLFTIGGASTGRGLWVADDESLAYVSAGTTLKKWTPSGGVEALAAGFVSLGNLWVDSNGDIVVADRGGHRVYRVTPLGLKTVIAGNGQRTGGGDGQPATLSGLNEIRGVWGHPDGGYFLATHRGGQIWYLDSVGYIHLFIHGDSNDSHAGDGLRFDDPAVRISEPRAVSLDRQGRMIITEHDGGYIRRVELQ